MHTTPAQSSTAAAATAAPAAKACATCRAVKPLQEFARHLNGHDGRRSHCRSWSTRRSRNHRPLRTCWFAEIRNRRATKCRRVRSAQFTVFRPTLATPHFQKANAARHWLAGSPTQRIR